jgi:hypothetical protein
MLDLIEFAVPYAGLVTLPERYIDTDRILIALYVGYTNYNMAAIHIQRVCPA